MRPFAGFSRASRRFVWTRRSPAVNTADLRLEKTFHLKGAARTVGIVAEAFNLNTQGALGSISRDGQRVVFAVPMPPQRKEITLAPETLASYTGTYIATGMEVVVTLEGNQLMIEVFGERIPLSARSETSFFFERRSEEVDFVKDEKGTVTHFLVYFGGPPVKAARK